MIFDYILVTNFFQLIKDMSIRLCQLGILVQSQKHKPWNKVLILRKIDIVYRSVLVSLFNFEHLILFLLLTFKVLNLLKVDIVYRSRSGVSI